jgi:glycine cleavage system H protein
MPQESEMSQVPADLLYSKEDEWVKVEDEHAIIGITDYAQDSLSDIVYLELPDVGDFFGAGETFGVVESVKAASDLFMPISGDITGVNEDLIDTPELLNEDPYGDAWMIKIKFSEPGQIDGLLDAQAYAAYLEERD